MGENSRFVVITPENLRIVSKKLAKKEGGILIAEPGPGSYQDNVVSVCLHLFAHPLIKLKGTWAFLYTERGTQDNRQTNWEDDREYLLRRRPQPSKDSVTNFCRELFDRLQIGDYEFRIGFQSMVGCGIFPRKEGLAMYVLPGDETLKQALACGLKHVINQMPEQNKALLLGAVEKMADYAVDDLKNNKIFRANVSAGMSVDIISG